MTQHPAQLPDPTDQPTPVPPPGLSSTTSPATSPALRQPRWSGKKTAVVAALAIGLSSAGAITASAAVPSGSGAGNGVGGPGGFGNARNFQPGQVQSDDAAAEAGRAWLLREYGSEEAIAAELAVTPGRRRVGAPKVGPSPTVRARISDADYAAFKKPRKLPVARRANSSAKPCTACSSTDKLVS